MNHNTESSAALVWRHQRLVWWIFVVNIVLAWLASLPARAVLSSVLDRSIASARFVAGFDMARFALVFEQPDAPALAIAPAAFASTFVFFIFVLFIEGGILSVLLDDRKQSRAEFFENSGLFFWRMVRLALYSLVPFAVLAAAHGSIHHWAGKLANDAPQERLGFVVDVVGSLFIALMALFVRMWFDLTQTSVVRENERRLLRTVLQTFRQALCRGKLYLEYIGIGVFAVVSFVLGAAIWLFLPHAATALTFLVLEAVTVTQIAARLWMKAASARWIALHSSASATLPAQQVQVAGTGPSLSDSNYSI